ncbi:MAG: TIGR04002 family protein [Acutalibacteraceae bacterium]|nr:TIGR04002 family protein [Oscillospiraceae bacterium]
MKNKPKLYLSAISALFAAICTVFVYFVHIPNPIGGYVHFADMFVFLAASILPLPYAALSGAVGFALADLVSGYPQYMLPSAIIRVLIVLAFTNKKEKILCKRNYIALPIAVAITVGGYAVTKYILYRLMQHAVVEVAFGAALSSIPGNLVQSIVSSVLYVLLSLALDKFNFKEQILPKQR